MWRRLASTDDFDNAVNTTIRPETSNPLADAARLVQQAEQRVALAARVLASLQDIALLLGHHDAEVYDRAILALRIAQQERLTALAVYRGTERVAKLEHPTPQQRFARWLVATGRLTEFPGE